jgi:hypothetical protein
LVENICPSHGLLMYIIFQGSLGFFILNTGNLDFVNFLSIPRSILRKFLHAKEKSKALYCVFDDDNHHCSCMYIVMSL